MQTVRIMGGEITYTFLNSITTGKREFLYILTINIYINEGARDYQAKKRPVSYGSHRKYGLTYKRV